jgi:DNA-binding GntR family transcriptional regulator
MLTKRKVLPAPAFAPLGDAIQLPKRVYDALLNGIIKGDLPPGTQLKADSIAPQLGVSSTPVRDALSRLVEDGLVHKFPYQGWFVSRFSSDEIRALYEMRANLECFAVRQACRRITPKEVENLRSLQASGEAALDRNDTEAYREYNHRFHADIMRAAKNSQLPAVFGQISLRVQMLSARSIRRVYQPPRAVKEHRALLDCIAKGDAPHAEAVMERHILNSLQEILVDGAD